MIFHPSILALHVASVLIGALVLFSTLQALTILLRWNPASGSELQLALERKTYLVSTLLACLFVFQLLSFFLYIFTADRLHTFFVGAMCAAGSLHANAYGYPALILKLVNFLLAGIWLILNYTDNRAYDYPLLRGKYALLLILAPLILIEAALQTAYFVNLKPEIITSCCGSLFSTGSVPEKGGLPLPPPALMKPLFYIGMSLALGSGLYFLLKGKGGRFFSAACVAGFFVTVLSFLVFISSYIYELPTHHCPFCILQKEYGHIGYFLYASVLGGVISGAGVGLLVPFRIRPSLRNVLPGIQKRLTAASLTCWFGLASYTVWVSTFSNLVLE